MGNALHSDFLRVSRLALLMLLLVFPFVCEVEVLAMVALEEQLSDLRVFKWES